MHSKRLICTFAVPKVPASAGRDVCTLKKMTGNVMIFIAFPLFIYKPTHSGNPFFQPPYALALLLCVGRFFVRFGVVAGVESGCMGTAGEVVGR